MTSPPGSNGGTAVADRATVAMTFTAPKMRGGTVRVEWAGMTMEIVIPENATDDEVARLVERAFSGVGCAVTCAVGPLAADESAKTRRRPGPPPRQETARERNERWRRVSR